MALARAPLFGLYSVYLSGCASKGRVDSKIYLGSGREGKASAAPAAATRQVAYERAFGNFTEVVPLGLVLASLVEVNGGDRRLLHAALGSFFVARIMHASLGLHLSDHVEGLEKNGYQIGRIGGFLGSLAVLTTLSTYALYLARPWSRL